MARRRAKAETAAGPEAWRARGRRHKQPRRGVAAAGDWAGRGGEGGRRRMREKGERIRGKKEKK